MKAIIIDNEHIKIEASAQEESLFANVDRICIDSEDTLSCSSDYSAGGVIIEKSDIGSIFNTSFKTTDLSHPDFTTDKLLILFLVDNAVIVQAVIPCYNHVELIESVAESSHVLTFKCGCNDSKNVDIHAIVLYYAFKLSLSVKDFRKAVKFWKRLKNNHTIIKNCNCNE